VTLLSTANILSFIMSQEVGIKTFQHKLSKLKGKTLHFEIKKLTNFMGNKEETISETKNGDKTNYNSY
jgi:hypothetical protein